ncbi:MAG: sigma-70 family RNA polymerase sigma factor [SAR202 cluster bacterium]|nr:sigma-70 family RNA polymerase sigma factor [SAR202 cluster bacterium]
MIKQDTAEVLAHVDSLVVRAQSGDRAALAGLYDHFYERIYRYVAFKTGSAAEAEDIAEEVFLRMLESIGSYKNQGVPFAAWLFRIAHNLIVDHHRKRSRERLTPLDDAAEIADRSHHSIEERLDVGLAIAQVNGAMDGLTDLQREVITLRFAGGLSVRETARAVGKKENAVKALQHAGINKLRRLLAPAGRPVEQPAIW